MNEQQAINWIHDQLKFGIKPGLKRVEWLLENLDHPENQLKLLHVAGTNGKGSTVSYMRNILEMHGFTVGTFTSPYIEIFNERISINGQPISGSQLVKYVELLQPLSDRLGNTELGRPTEFELITVIALKFFYDSAVDYAIFEVGLGGRLDSTNVINPILSLITMIGYDHTDILGDTLEEISYEKAGIIKSEAPVITNVLENEAFQVIKEQAASKRSPLYRLHEDYHYSWVASRKQGEIFTFVTSDLQIDNIKLSMSGKHQIENATIAIYSIKKISEIEGFSLSIEKIIEGIEKTKWIGRFEIIHTNPTIILDGAHNLEAICTLVNTIEQRYSNEDVHILLSILKNKPIIPMLQTLQENFENITIATFNFFRSYRYKELLPYADNYGIIVSENWKQTIQNFIDSGKTDRVLIITGSLYFISEVRDFLTRTNSETN
ncbi:bifunctional folylpolyglutamate synthase/dihydrofolate synthase [Filobacillus milosensis]|uniref:Dihydrofolate synthase/folylpolyglutamate synthase n=1 Tax=Filobacillus milosensis TaxID=94137 RepID=A0A4Y8IUT1_9BACI|nr:folylpolyglutamate synthase/dihydrofolate synthase family protein [Filobacillus milosensis]TFB24939.1 bifunctional folylpolyglutamate synthase/dihydrofolate synthase [Filobacillus milosensis]